MKYGQTQTQFADNPTWLWNFLKNKLEKGLSSMVHAILTNLNILSGQYNFVQKKKKGGNQRDTDINPKSR